MTTTKKSIEEGLPHIKFIHDQLDKPLKEMIKEAKELKRSKPQMGSKKLNVKRYSDACQENLNKIAGHIQSLAPSIQGFSKLTGDRQADPKNRKILKRFTNQVRIAATAFTNTQIEFSMMNYPQKAADAHATLLKIVPELLHCLEEIPKTAKKILSGKIKDNRFIHQLVMEAPSLSKFIDKLIVINSQ